MKYLALVSFLFALSAHATRYECQASSGIQEETQILGSFTVRPDARREARHTQTLRRAGVQFKCNPGKNSEEFTCSITREKRRRNDTKVLAMGTAEIGSDLLRVISVSGDDDTTLTLECLRP